MTRIVCRGLIIGLALTLGWGVATGPVLAQKPPLDIQKIKEKFETANKNKDGRIDRGEFHQWMVEVFYLRDTAKKGYLVAADLPEMGPEVFQAINRKADGKLSLDEFTSATFKDFEAADSNQDGVLTWGEVERYVRDTQ